jgi:uncharacterized protein YndB with AHSA1/START domain
VRTVRRTRGIDATPDEVWRLVSDPYSLPRWWPSVVRVEDASDDAWTKVMRAPRGGIVRADYTRLESRPRTRLVWRQELEESPFERIFSSSVIEIELQPEGSAGSRVQLAAVQQLRGRFRLGSFMVRRASKRLLDEALDGIERAMAPA